ncbi:MAG: hypothetical protein SP1CHLAM42_10990 [Chlamydiales bacterium]|nr:hypothetical protein [Chlamydiales bacterium]
MTLFPKQPDLIGVECDSDHFRIAAIKQQRRSWHIIHLKEISRSSPLGEALLKEAVVSTAPLPRHLLIRPFHMQLKREKDIRSALDFQVESLLPFPAAEAVVEAQIGDSDEKGSAMTLSVLKRDHLQKHLDGLAPFEPECVTCAFSALCAFSTLLPESAQRLLLIHVGKEDIACALVEGGRLLKAHSFECSKDFETELRKTVLAMNPKSFESIYLLGSEEELVIDAVKKATGETPHFPNIPQLHLSSERLVKYGLAIGIAIAGQRVNFRKKEFAYPHPLKRFKRPFAIFLGLTALFTTAFFIFCNFSLSRQELAVSHAFQTLAASAEYHAGSSLNLASEYNIELQKIEKEIVSKPDTFPLLPAVPKVREVLSFLTRQAGEISTQDFSYQLVKRPSFGQKKEHYRVRVDLEFTVQDASVARQLHEKLQSSNSLVDPKMDVTWECVHGCYKTSFFLKDKTRYHG